MAKFTYDFSKFISFRDKKVCARVRVIRKEEITKHPNPEFKIKIIENPDEFYFEFALDIVTRIKKALDEGIEIVMILPTGPTPQYKIGAHLINELKIPCKHVHTFNMDEYADQNGNTAPLSWEGSFQKAMWENFFNLIEKDLRPSEKQIHFPTDENISYYGKLIEDMGGADICYGGVGWAGHIAFWEPHLGYKFGDKLDSYMKAGPRIVELHPITIMQNALHSFGGDWSWVPPKAATIGPAQIVGAKYRSFWLDGYIGGGISWQRFIARLAAHGPINTLVPASILQKFPTNYTMLGGVADNCEIAMR